MELEMMSKAAMMEKIILLERENLSLREKFERVIEKCMPLVDKIEAAKGLFKAFIVLKLAIKLTDLLIQEFRK